MSLDRRVLALALAGGTLLAGCRGAGPRIDFDAAGRNAAVVITAQHETHVIYVDGARRLMHRRVGDDAAVAISPAGDAVDLRGENAPIFVERGDGALLVVYPVAVPGGASHRSASELRAQLSRDGGRSWSAPRRVDGDAAPRSHNFADFALGRGGDGVLSWLDSRAGQQGVQTTVLHSDLTVAPVRTADAKSCQCCRTALFAASNGELWLAWRDLAEGNVRNIAYAVSRGAGEPFTPRGDVADDRWSIDGCPESGPRFAETADGTVWLAWLNGAANAIEIAAAPRGGRFETRAVVAAGNHPDIGTLPDGRLVVFYESFRGGKRAVDRRVSDAAHAHWSAARTIAADGMTPRYVRRGGDARLSYTSMTGGTPRVHVIDISGMQ
ncbi:MAG TPA: sialidase family protein [Thermoanaerobaculia bacterium]|jgi:hypothetical protein